ncbi:cytochrome c oxidase subunit II [Litorimonas sp. RW-G-Af-16]|uniref:cytochrome c oxidase subunit II n=1 Tax=Litorimonas sp. RW-G-Af-16 TaxID=3241168 RepID=UPI00390C41F4
MRFKRPNIGSLVGGAAASLLMSASVMAQDSLGKPVEKGYWLQDSATPVMDELTRVHNLVFYIICGIVAFVTVLLLYIMIRFREKANPVPSKTSHNTMIEVVWTIVPVLILLVMVVPSMQLLYMQDRLPETEMTVKAVGNTWNWEYSYPDYENVDSFVSNPLDQTAAKEAGVPYLLATDAALVVPVDTKIKVLVTSVNNMHSWAMPSFGVKMDAVPGIINETWFEVTKEGTFYGQCSEICGAKHYFMPIEVKAVSKAEFAQWIANDGEFTTQTASLDAPTSNNMGGGVITAAQK